MGSIEEHFGQNTMSIASLHNQFRDLWKSPRGTVIRIEALTLVAIVYSIYHAFSASCRRWSNRWSIQTGLTAALSMSLGTYSIGVMQSSQVKSEIYPIWAVSLLVALFGYVDPITTYVGKDYKGPLLKMIFQLCLYFGYVMLMNVSTMSNVVGKLAIVLLSTITFIKGFHRALAFVLPGEIWEQLSRGCLDDSEPDALAGDGEGLKVQLPLDIGVGGILKTISIPCPATMADIKRSLPKGTPVNSIINDVCLSYSFSHLLRQRFLGFDTGREMEKKLKSVKVVQNGRPTIDYKWALKVVEVELAFLFDSFFTSNEYIHFYQRKIEAFLSLASFVAICFVAVVAAIIPGAMASSHSNMNPAAATVSITTVDQIITLVILVSVALLQLVQLIQCLTSKWATVGIACEYAKANTKQMLPDQGPSDVEVTGGDGQNDDPQMCYEEELCSSSNTRSSNKQTISWWVMRLRLFLVDKVNCFAKNHWKSALGQHSLHFLVLQRRWTQDSKIRRVLFALHSQECPIVLDDDVKTSITKFLGTIESRRIGVEWSALFVQNGLQDWLEYLPYTNTSVNEREASAFTRRVMIWHIATWYCEEAEKAAGGYSGGEYSSSKDKNRYVAMSLSRYCVYLVVSAPELLPGRAGETKRALDDALGKTLKALRRENNTIASILEVEMAPVVPSDNPGNHAEAIIASEFVMTGVNLGKRLLGLRWGRIEEDEEQSTRRPCSSDNWELLALLWTQTLLYAAPYGDTQAHMQRLARAGEFITHLWALLYHLGIDKWEVAGIDVLKAGAAAETIDE